MGGSYELSPFTKVGEGELSIIAEGDSFIREVGILQ